MRAGRARIGILDNSHRHSERGRIELICGCMFAGKTARLIELLEAARAAGLTTAAFKHVLDRRYRDSELATHDNRHFPAEALAAAEEIETHAAGGQVIGVDEGQFFGPPLVETVLRLRTAGRRIIIAGIDYNAWGHDFGPFPKLKEIADAVEVLTRPCGVCGQPARYTQRMTPVVEGRMVGGPGEYEPRCETCFVPLPGAGE